MSRLDGVNLAALLAALVLAAVGTLQFTRPSAISNAGPALETTPGITRVALTSWPSSCGVRADTPSARRRTPTSKADSTAATGTSCTANTGER